MDHTLRNKKKQKNSDQLEKGQTTFDSPPFLQKGTSHDKAFIRDASPILEIQDRPDMTFDRMSGATINRKPKTIEPSLHPIKEKGKTKKLDQIPDNKNALGYFDIQPKEPIAKSNEQKKSLPMKKKSPTRDEELIEDDLLDLEAIEVDENEGIVKIRKGIEDKEESNEGESNEGEFNEGEFNEEESNEEESNEDDQIFIDDSELNQSQSSMALIKDKISNHTIDKFRKICFYYYRKNRASDSDIKKEFDELYVDKVGDKLIPLLSEDKDPFIEMLCATFFIGERSYYYLMSSNGIPVTPAATRDSITVNDNNKLRKCIIIQPFSRIKKIDENYRPLLNTPLKYYSLLPRFNKEKIKKIKDITYAGIYKDIFILIIDKYPIEIDQDDPGQESKLQEINKNNTPVFQMCKFNEDELDVCNLVDNVSDYNPIGYHTKKYPFNENLTIYNSAIFLNTKYPFSGCSIEYIRKRKKNKNDKIQEKKKIIFKEYDICGLYSMLIANYYNRYNLFNNLHCYLSESLINISAKLCATYITARYSEKNLKKHYDYLFNKFIMTHGNTIGNPIAAYIGNYFNLKQAKCINTIRKELGLGLKKLDIEKFRDCIVNNVPIQSRHIINPLLKFINAFLPSTEQNDGKVVLFLGGPYATGKSKFATALEKMNFNVFLEIPRRQKKTGSLYKNDLSNNHEIIFLDNLQPKHMGPISKFIFNAPNDTKIYQPNNKDSVRTTKLQGVILCSNFCDKCLMKKTSMANNYSENDRIYVLNLGYHDCKEFTWKNSVSI